MLNACSQKTPQSTEAEPTPTSDQVLIAEQPVSQKIVDEANYKLGLEALALRDYARAKRLFSNFIKSNPSMSGAYINLALIAFREDDFSDVSKLLDQAITLNPIQAQAYHLRAHLHLKNSAIKLALKDYLKAIELIPDYANAHYNLALLYDIFLQEIALAIDHYTIYLSLLDKEDEKTRNWIKHLQNTLDND
ncbi:MAG: tetratricopeptide repeat protein [Gammaproteobacteria bacterium]|nr:tetratricopeptide repeat protein [Gammaproteobacteria bacterium]